MNHNQLAVCQLIVIQHINSMHFTYKDYPVRVSQIYNELPPIPKKHLKKLKQLGKQTISLAKISEQDLRQHLTHF